MQIELTDLCLKTATAKAGRQDSMYERLKRELRDKLSESEECWLEWVEADDVKAVTPDLSLHRKQSDE